MKLQVYRTAHPFLEEPLKFGMCGTFNATRNYSICGCPTKTNPEKLHIAEIEMGNFKFDCKDSCANNGCEILVPVRTGTANPDIPCNCCR